MHAQLHCGVAVHDDAGALVLFPLLGVGVGACLLPAVLLTPSWFVDISAVDDLTLTGSPYH